MFFRQFIGHYDIYNTLEVFNYSPEVNEMDEGNGNGKNIIDPAGKLAN